jgi:hypothetical protein
MIPVIEPLSSKHEALSSTPSTGKTKKREVEKRKNRCCQEVETPPDSFLPPGLIPYQRAFFWVLLILILQIQSNSNP